MRQSKRLSTASDVVVLENTVRCAHCITSNSSSLPKPISTDAIRGSAAGPLGPSPWVVAGNLSHWPKSMA